eukprot:scaffold101_cov230-Pinguiococcus_pyrenoidosus.AAC.16
MKRKAVAGEFKSAREAKKKTTTAEDSLSIMDIGMLCDAIPGFLRLLANHFPHSEQIHVLSLVSKAWKAAMPLYLPVRRRREAVIEFLDAFFRNSCSDTFWWSLPIEDEFLDILGECDVRMWNVEVAEEVMEERREIERQRAELRAAGKNGGAGFNKLKHEQLTLQMRIRVRPDASCVVSLDLDQKHMELKIQTTPRKKNFYFHCQGTIVGWAKRRVRFSRTSLTIWKGLSSPYGDSDEEKEDGHQEDDPAFTFETLLSEERALRTGDLLESITAELPEAPKEGEEWQYYAIVDVGVVRLSDYHTDDRWWALERHALVMPGRRAEELYYGLAEREVEEGVVYVDAALSDMQRSTLMAAVDRLRTAHYEAIDSHPHSENKVRDLVNPDLYAYVEGESPFNGSQDLPDASMAPRPLDGTDAVRDEYGRLLPLEDFEMWGRKYDNSKYQWLPTYFKVASDCKVHIEDYINGVSRAAHPELYAWLEALFERFVPLLEHAWTYGLELRFQEFGHVRLGWHKVEIDRDSRFLMPLRRSRLQVIKKIISGFLVPLRGSRLQVVTKIVDYVLQPGEEHEIAWQVQGIPEENIAATCMYVAACDEGFEGGKLRFKRAFDDIEGDRVHQLCGDPLTHIKRFANRGMLPLGVLDTPENRMLVSFAP